MIFNSRPTSIMPIYIYTWMERGPRFGFLRISTRTNFNSFTGTFECIGPDDLETLTKRINTDTNNNSSNRFIANTLIYSALT